jgi:tetratricopeptide (TPR) repeat protein
MIYSGASVSAAVAGDYVRAIELATKGVELDSGSSFSLLALAQAYGYAGKIEKVRPLLEQAIKYPGYTCPYESAIVYLQLGETDRAFELLNDAVDFRSNCLVFVLNDPRLAAYRNDLRYSSILTRVGLDKETVFKYSH